jgi:alcohol dehydrogenase (cytochrome c)
MKLLTVVLLFALGLTGQDSQSTWQTYGKNSLGWRYSDLAQINTSNVANIAPQWIFQTRVPGNMETSPLVIDGLMYFTAQSNHAFAVDLRSGKLVWHYQKMPPKQMSLCCGEVNRGLAVLGNRLFKVNIEDTLVALDLKTGKVLWETEIADYRKGYSGTLAPLVVKDKVLVGTAGAEFGTRGFVDAYDPVSGKRLWRFYTVPGPGEPGSETWGNRENLGLGGSTWVTGTYDPELNLTYWGTGNPGPDLDGDVRPGDNLFTNSMIALDPDTGKLKWYFQFTPHDTHDWDSIGDPVLVDLAVAGRKIKGLIHANRNGHFYVLDRTNGKFLLAKAYTKVSWADGIGPDGRPNAIPNLDPTEQGRKVCPGLSGGHNWQATAYSPQTGLYYFTSTDGCQAFYKNTADFVEGEWYELSHAGPAPGEPAVGSLIALDPNTGQMRWRHETNRTPSGGVLATAGGLVLTGDFFGNVIALDARTGKVLWHFQTGAPIMAPPVSYAVDGKQFIAIAAGEAMVSFSLPPGHNAP